MIMWCELEITGTKVVVALFYHYYTMSFSGHTDEQHGKLQAHALTETWTVYLLNGSGAYCHLSYGTHSCENVSVAFGGVLLITNLMETHNRSSVKIMGFILKSLAFPNQIEWRQDTNTDWYLKILYAYV